MAADYRISVIFSCQESATIRQEIRRFYDVNSVFNIYGAEAWLVNDSGYGDGVYDTPTEKAGMLIMMGGLGAAVAAPVVTTSGLIAVGKELLSEGLSQVTNGATDLLSLKGAIKNAGGP